LGVVYKLVEFDGNLTAKYTDTVAKRSLPGVKEIYRIWTVDSEFPACDVITVKGEEIKDVSIITVFELNSFDMNASQ